MPGPFAHGHTTCSPADNLTFPTFQNLYALLHLFSVRYNTDEYRCNFTFDPDGALILSIHYNDQWRCFLIEEQDFNLLPDTLFQDINKLLDQH